MRRYQLEDPVVVNREKFIHPSGTPAQMAKRRRRAHLTLIGTKGAQALVAKLKRQGY